MSSPHPPLLTDNLLFIANRTFALRPLSFLFWKTFLWALQQLLLTHSRVSLSLNCFCSSSSATRLGDLRKSLVTFFNELAQIYGGFKGNFGKHHFLGKTCSDYPLFQHLVTLWSGPRSTIQYSGLTIIEEMLLLSINLHQWPSNFNGVLSYLVKIFGRLHILMTSESLSLGTINTLGTRSRANVTNIF